MGINDVITRASRYLPNLNRDRLEKAYDFAKDAHEGQRRMSGEDFIIHPVTTAYILTEFKLDEDTLIAALLHDVPEDTKTTLSNIKRLFGSQVAKLVDGITKLKTKVHFKQDMHESQIETLRKMFLAMAADIRVVLIKLADRLHNMRTLSTMPPDERVRKAKETLEIYVPLADRLGIWGLKWRLEDLCFQHLHVAEYELLKRQVAADKLVHHKHIDELQHIMQHELDKENIQSHVSSRIKNLYSIYKKMKEKDKQFHEIFDIIALRIIVPTIKDCYAALGIVHRMFKPKVSRFKDYVAVPKVNGYQSLHTTVFGPGGKLTEIQIRTQDMHEEAEYGIAAHWYYRESGRRTKAPGRDKLIWIRNMAEIYSKTKSQEFLENMRLDFFNDRIFVFTPQGDVIDLPQLATPLDLAFQIHTDLGYHCMGTKINDKMMPLNTSLHNGDIVEIIASKQQRGPSRDWLDIVKTNQAKSKIRAALKKQNAAVNKQTGKEKLKKTLEQLGHYWDRFSTEKKKQFAHVANCKTIDELYLQIGEGAIHPHHVFRKVYSKEDIFDVRHKIRLKVKKGKAEDKKGKDGKKKDLEILVAGERDLLIHLASCCCPTYKNQIVGYVTKGRGIAIHRKDCRLLNGLTKRKLIPASWSDEGGKSYYPVTILIKAAQTVGMLHEISQKIYSLNLKVTDIIATNIDEDTATFKITIEVADLDSLQELFYSIENIVGVKKVERVRQDEQSSSAQYLDT